jgi:hypothetical protein
MAERAKADKESLKNLAFNAADDEIFGGADDGQPADRPDEDADAADDAERDAAAAADEEDDDAAGTQDRRAKRAPSAGKTDADPRLAEVEPLFAQGNWQRVCELLGPPERADELPAPLALLYATARKEHDPEQAAEANPLAIRSMATLLGVPADSQTAVIVAKRILRRNPAAWAVRAAPPAPTRVVLILATVVLGAVIGWLLGPSGIQLDEVLREALR